MRREGDRGWATCQDYKAGVQRFRRFSFALTIARELGPGSHFPVSKSWVKDVAPGRLRLLCRCPPGSIYISLECVTRNHIKCLFMSAGIKSVVFSLTTKPFTLM